MVFCVVNRSCGETRGSSCSRRRKASIFSLGQSERLAKVRWRVFLPSRQPSRRRMAGGELRLGTTAIYMRTLTNINPNLSREIYSYMRTQINENQVAVRAKPHIFKILTSNRASTVGWNFGLASKLSKKLPVSLKPTTILSPHQAVWVSLCVNPESTENTSWEGSDTLESPCVSARAAAALDCCDIGVDRAG